MYSNYLVYTWKKSRDTQLKLSNYILLKRLEVIFNHATCYAYSTDLMQRRTRGEAFAGTKSRVMTRASMHYHSWVVSAGWVILVYSLLAARVQSD